MRRTAQVVAGAATAALLMAGCGGSDAPGARVSPTAPTAPTATTATSSPTTASSTPTSDYPGPASSGQSISIEGISLNAPEGWLKVPASDLADNSVLLSSQDFTMAIGVSSRAALQTNSIDEQAARFITDSGYERPLKKVDSVEIAGQEWYHLTGQADATKSVDAFGTAAPGGREVRVTFESMLSVDTAAQQSAITSVLASVVLN